MKTPILIVGGGTGGVAAALAVAESGGRCVLTEETDWIGGQLTSQIVPPDEHPWIEMFGCTRSYRAYRDGVRAFYRDRADLAPDIPAIGFEREFNPGGGWVSRLCHEPTIGSLVLIMMLAPHLTSGAVELLHRTKPLRAFTDRDRIEGVEFVALETGRRLTVEADLILDATELGDLLWLSGTEYALGSDARSETGEPHAAEVADPNDVQGLTWCFAMRHDLAPGANHVGDAPEGYARWREYRPPFWPGRHFGFQVLHAHTGEVRTLPLYSPTGDWYELFSYRQIVDPAKWTLPHYPETVVNWPQNDYFVRSILDVDPLPADIIPEGFEVPGAMGPNAALALDEAKQMSRGLLYWLQTEAPRHDGNGVGYPGLFAAPETCGTPDGFAKVPYIREARRLRALKLVTEQEVAAYTNPGLDRAPSFPDSVGVGAYRIDLHPSTSGATTIDTSTLPFEIPLGALVPQRVTNLIAAGKCLGVTHVTNGCYRLHPVEWNVGEAAGTLAAMCVAEGTTPHAVAESPKELQRRLEARGVELRWPVLRAL